MDRWFSCVLSADHTWRNVGLGTMSPLFGVLDPSCWASLVAQMVKNLLEMQETWVWSLGQEDPLEKGMATHSSILAWEIPWTEESGELMSTGLQRVRPNWATNTHTLAAITSLFPLDQWVSSCTVCQNNLKGLFVLRLLGPTPRVADSCRSGAQHENVQSQQVPRWIWCYHTLRTTALDQTPTSYALPGSSTPVLALILPEFF